LLLIAIFVLKSSFLSLATCINSKIRNPFFANKHVLKPAFSLTSGFSYLLIDKPLHGFNCLLEKIPSNLFYLMLMEAKFTHKSFHLKVIF